MVHKAPDVLKLVSICKKTIRSRFQTFFKVIDYKIVMFSNDLNNILSLIAASIFADKHVYDSEIDAFVASTLKLKIAKTLEPKLSRTRLLVWFDQNKITIRQRLETPYFKDWFYDLLNQLANIQDKQSILNAMRDIARADGEVHISERALITLAERHWGIGTSG